MRVNQRKVDRSKCISVFLKQQIGYGIFLSKIFENRKIYHVRKVTLRKNFLKFSKKLGISKMKNLAHYSTDLNGQSWGLRLNTNGLLRRCSTPLPVSTFLAKLGPCAESYVEKCPFQVFFRFRRILGRLIIYRPPEHPLLIIPSILSWVRSIVC